MSLPSFPGWRQWRSGALHGAAVMVYSAWVAFVQIPDPQAGQSGNPRWWVLGIGVALACFTWYTLAGASAREGKKDEEQKARDVENAATQRLAKFLTINVPLREWHVQQNKKMTAEIAARVTADFSALLDLYRAREMQEAPASLSANRVIAGVGFSASRTSVHGVGEAIVTPDETSGTDALVALPGTGELKLDGFEPTVTIATLLDREIQEQERRIIRNFGYAIQYNDGTLGFHSDEPPVQPDLPKQQDPS